MIDNENKPEEVVRQMKFRVSIIEDDEEKRKAKYIALGNLMDNLRLLANKAVTHYTMLFQEEDDFAASLPNPKNLTLSEPKMNEISRLSSIKKKSDEEKGRLKELKQELKELRAEQKCQNGLDKYLFLQKRIEELTGKKLSGQKGKMIQNFPYYLYEKDFPEIYDTLPSEAISNLYQSVHANVKSDRNEVRKGERSIRNYRNMDVPFQLQKNGITKIEKDTYEFFLFPRKLGIRFKIVTGRDKNGGATNILEKILSGEYKIATSYIRREKKPRRKHNKWFLALSYKMPVEKVELDSSIAVGVDLGINSIAVAGLCKGSGRLYMTGIKDDCLRFKQMATKKREYAEKRRDSYSRAKYNMSGHGRKRKMKKVYDIKDRESRFVKTVLHKVSKKIVDFAVQNRAGTIKMEDLTSLSRLEEQAGKFTREWQPSALQDMIAYKAHQKGIVVIKVNPAYTSQICHVCGNHDKESRSRDHASNFNCTNTKCNWKGNADYNASVNIARVEDIRATYTGKGWDKPKEARV